MSLLVQFGIVLIFIGFIVIFVGLSQNSSSNTKVAVGGFIGFIPFGFGNDKNMVYFSVIVSVALFLLFLFMNIRK